MSEPDASTPGRGGPAIDEAGAACGYPAAVKLPPRGAYAKRFGRVVPDEWPELLASERERTTAALVALRSSLLYLSRRNAKEKLLPQLPLFHEAAAVLGADAVRPLLPKLDAAFRSESDDAADRIEIASAANLVVCAGEKPPAAADAWLRGLASIAERKRALSLQHLQTLSLAAICLGEPERVAAIVGGGRLPRRFKSGETFGLDAGRFIRYLATATIANAHPDGVAPAWRSFLGAFPRKMAVASIHWRDLIWAARAVHVVIREDAIGSVVATLHAEIAAIRPEDRVP